MRSYYPKSFNICVNCVVVNNFRGIFHLSIRLTHHQTCCDCDHGLKTIYFKLHVWESGVRFDSKIKSMSKFAIASAIISKIIPE